MSTSYKNYLRAAYVDEIIKREEDLLNRVTQREPDDWMPGVYFEFYFKPAHPFSERLKAWFEENKVDYFVAEQNLEGFAEQGGVCFHNRDDLAMLFKLTFVNV